MKLLCVLRLALVLAPFLLSFGGCTGMGKLGHGALGCTASASGSGILPGIGWFSLIAAAFILPYAFRRARRAKAAS